MGKHCVPNTGSAVKVPTHKCHEGEGIDKTVEEFDSSQLVIRIDIEKKEGVTVFGVERQNLYVPQVYKIAL
jgi:hypothetical protein